MFLSPAKRTFRYSYVVQSLAFLPIAFAILLGFVVDREQLVQPAWLITLFVLIAAGIVLFLAFNRQQIAIHDEGVAARSLFGTKEIRWEDVTELRYSQTVMAQAALAHFGLLGYLIMPFVGRKESSKKGSQTLKIVSHEQVKIDIDSYYKDGVEAIRTVLERVHPRLLSEARGRVQQGETVRFGNLGVSALGVQWKSKELMPYSSMKEVGIVGSNFRIKLEGKWLDAVSVRCQTVPNLFVALDLIREKMNQGVTSEAKSFAAVV